MEPVAYSTLVRPTRAMADIRVAPLQSHTFLPALLDKQLRPEVLRHEDPRFDDAIRYMAWVSDEFAPHLQVEGHEVVIGTG